MSRRKKKSRTPSASRTPSPRTDQRERIIRERAAIYCCPNSLADDFRLGCQTLVEDTEIEIDFARVAIEIWSTRTSPPADLIATLTALVAEHRRHHLAIAALQERFDSVAGEEATKHEHIDPLGPIQDLLRAWVFYDPPAD